jgi:hypothetical protein
MDTFVIHTIRVYKSDSHKDFKFAATCTCQTDGRFASEGEAMRFADEHKIKRTKGIDSVVIVNEIHPPKVEAKPEEKALPPYAAGAAKPQETVPPYARKA